MRSARHFHAAMLLLLLWLAASCAVSARASALDSDDDYPDEYDVTARVVRVSLLRGEVSLRRAGSKDWEQARLNFPLVEGDTLATGHDARLEIQIDSRNFVRVAGDSVLRLVTLRDEGVALSLSEGTATLRLARFDHDREYFEIDAPKTTLAAEKSGLYRLDVSRGGEVHLTVRDGGRARIYSETSGFTLRDGRAADLSFADDASEADWQLSQAPDADAWDDWVNERERFLVQRLRYEERERYYDDTVWGAEELDAYGDWTNAGDYGWVWRPHVTVINNYYNWAPYRYGHWTWCPPYGWTWVGDEPWGWAPYHYGRWVYYNNSWCWAPRGYGYHYRRAYWRPALVAFVFLAGSYGEQVAWYPLTYGQHDPHSRYYQQNRPERLRPLRADEVARLERINPASLRAVTTLPARNFGSDDTRTQPATNELARRAIAGEPVRGRLPIMPARPGSDGGGAAGPGMTDRPARVRLPNGINGEALAERPTGAATRRPGVPLDDELRRTRLFNGREPRVSPGGVDRGGNVAGSGIGGGNTGGGPARDASERDTGAVTRPARPAHGLPVERRVDGEPGGVSDGRDAGGVNQPSGRPGRPARPIITGPDRPPVTDDGNRRNGPVERRPTPERRPLPETPQYEQPDVGTTPQRPGRIDGPERPVPDGSDETERRVRPSRREPVERPEPSDRTERRDGGERRDAEERRERPERHEPERREPVRREPERREPEPQRSEPPRSEPPHRSEEPAPSRSEPRHEQQPQRERNDAPARPSRTSTKDGREP